MKIELNTKVFEAFPELESSKLKYIHITLKDADTLFIIRTNKDVMKYMDTDPMKSISDSEKLIESLDESFKSGNGINWGIIEKTTDKFIGYFGIWRIDQKHCRGEIGYALHPDYWGKGYMQETINTIVEFGFNKLNLHSYEANVNPDNLDSIKLLEKLGFKKEAYFRENFLFNNEFKDSIIYSLLEKDLLKNENI
jgi:ribosomal-protein-alanine N-acetyltransferase